MRIPSEFDIQFRLTAPAAIVAMLHLHPSVEPLVRSGKAYADTARWGAMSLLNTARSGKFSSDRTIHQYCEEIWTLPLGNG